MNNAVILGLALVVMTALGAIGSLFLKKSVSRCHDIVKVVLEPYFILGGLFYFVSALLDIWLLRHLRYVVVLPLTSLTYVWSMLLAKMVLRERVSALKVTGLIFVIGGMLALVL